MQDAQQLEEKPNSHQLGISRILVYRLISLLQSALLSRGYHTAEHELQPSQHGSMQVDHPGTEAYLWAHVLPGVQGILKDLH